MAVSGARREYNNGGKRRIARSGTPVATIAKLKSVASDRAAVPVEGASGPAGKGWGGARNRRERPSDGVSPAKARDFLAAVAHAGRIGLALNRHCTIHWERAGVADADAARATGDYLNRARDWLRTRGLPFASAHVREHGEGKGSHVHILLHLPPAARAVYLARHRRWVALAAGGRYVPGAVKSSNIGGNLAGIGEGPVYSDNLAYAIGYLLKGVTRAVALELDLQRRRNRAGDSPDDWGQGGRVVGKRVGWSENIGKAARERWAANVR